MLHLTKFINFIEDIEEGLFNNLQVQIKLVGDPYKNPDVLVTYEGYSSLQRLLYVEEYERIYFIPYNLEDPVFSPIYRREYGTNGDLWELTRIFGYVPTVHEVNLIKEEYYFSLRWQEKLSQYAEHCDKYWSNTDVPYLRLQGTEYDRITFSQMDYYQAILQLLGNIAREHELPLPYRYCKGLYLELTVQFDSEESIHEVFSKCFNLYNLSNKRIRFDSCLLPDDDEEESPF